MSVAFVVLLAGVLVVWRKRRSSAAAVVTEQQEQLLYSHIPGTPTKRGAAGAAKGATSAWAGGKGSAAALQASGGTVVPKKLSNLPA